MGMGAADCRAFFLFPGTSVTIEHHGGEAERSGTGEVDGERERCMLRLPLKLTLAVGATALCNVQ